MKKIFCILLIIAMIFTMAACGNKGPTQVPEEEEIMSPTNTLDAFLKAFKARDVDELNEYYEGESDDLIFWKDMEEPALEGLMDKMMAKLLDFDYVLSNEKIDGKNATVDVNFKTYDIGGIMTDIFNSLKSDLYTLAISGLSPEELEAEISDIMAKKFEEYSEIAKKEKVVAVPVKLVMINNKWFVKDLSRADEIKDALSGGLIKFAENIGDIFG
ncbi:MAG: hypothetical protein J6Q41_04800 [Firmicutes bacterium]|nr:hypothetical protein [Bacillota bacterium]